MELNITEKFDNLKKLQKTGFPSKEFVDMLPEYLKKTKTRKDKVNDVIKIILLYYKLLGYFRTQKMSNLPIIHEERKDISIPEVQRTSILHSEVQRTSILHSFRVLLTSDHISYFFYKFV